MTPLFKKNTEATDDVSSYSFEECRAQILVQHSTHLCRNISAGSMFTEVSRTTCRISLAIILSFSKLTRPSTLESLPGEKKKQWRAAE